LVGRVNVRGGILVIAAAPGCLLAAGLALALVLGAIDRHPMWPYVALNLSEAAGARDEGEVARLIAYGEDPNTRREVRAGVIFARATRLTPLEAAVAVDDPSILTRLLTLGATLDADVWNRLRCIADGDEVPPVLDARRPEGVELHCVGVTPPW
ncbi:MAG: hypothetical protein ACRD8O_22575, partial [Bryobacteraceae bacterium]